MEIKSPTGASHRSSLQVRYLIAAAILALIAFALLLIWTNWNLVLTWVLAWTPVAFLFYGYDKFLARRDRLRIPEISLLTLSAAGGFAGAIAAMFLFHHKTAKMRFWIVNVMSLAVWAFLLFVTVF
jgi:uncharacterized membrane protein YsdA (DUF1294 family)